MRAFSSLVFAGALLTSVAACDRIADQLPLSGLKGYSACLKEGAKGAVLSQVSTKIYCSAKYQTDLPLNTLSNARAGLGSCSPEVDFSSQENLALERSCSTFEGTFENKTTTYVITSIEVFVTNSRSKKTETKTVDNLWIEPNDPGEFTLALENPFKRKNWSAPNDSFEWNITAVKGFKIDY